MRHKPKRHHSSGASTLEYTLAVAAIGLACTVAIEFMGLSISNSLSQATAPGVQLAGVTSNGGGSVETTNAGTTQQQTTPDPDPGNWMP